MADTALHRSPLHDLHLSLGAKMVPFAGYLMPVQYSAGIIAEHLHTRTKAGLFDVSHMGQVRLEGALGKTGLLVSEMGVGTWGLSGDAYGAVPEKDAEAVVRRCLEMGMNVVDTADVYGGGRMEAMLGRILKTKRDVIVVTKGGTDRTTDPPRKRFDAEWIK